MLRLTKRYPGKRVFITGTGSGLGAALALQFAADGWTVAMCDINASSLADSARAVTAAGGKPITWTLDVTDRAAYARVVDEALQQMGGVDVVVNNAGVAGAGLIGDYSLDDWEWLLRINLLGPIYGCHYFVPHLRKQKAGHVINIASAAALAPVPTMAAYCTAKVGVKMLSEVLANEVHQDGIDVTVVMPEFFRTNIYQGMRGNDGDRARAQKLVGKASFSADQVAKVIVEQAGKRELYVTFPPRVRALWWLLRASPMLGNQFIRRGQEVIVRRRSQ